MVAFFSAPASRADRDQLRHFRHHKFHCSSLVDMAYVFGFWALFLCPNVTQGEEPPAQLKVERAVTSLAYSPDGKLLITGDEGGAIKVWSFPDLKESASLTAQKDVVSVISFKPDGKLFATGCADKTITLWHPEHRQYMTTQVVKNPPRSLAYSSDGTILAVGDAVGTIMLLSGNNLKILTPSIEGHTGFISSLAFSPDGTLLASGGRGPDLKLWDVAKQKKVADLDGHEDHVTGVAFSPDGQTLCSSSLDGTVKLWDVATRKEKATLKGPSKGRLTCMALSPDGKTLAAGGNFKEVWLWDAATLKAREPLKGHTDDVLALAFGPDSKTLATSGKDRTVRFWALKEP